MRFMGHVFEGFSLARRHRRLALVIWLAPLVPALMLGAMAASNLAPTLGGSIFADRILTGDWFVVWTEFRSSPRDALDPIFSAGAMTMLLLSLPVQVLLSAGIVETLLEKSQINPFVLGIRRNTFSFARTAVLLLVLTAVVAVGCRLTMKGFSKIAEILSDGRFDLVGIAVAGVLFIALWAPLDLAADLSRIAAARHADRSMVRGLLRAWWTVIRRPDLFVPLYLVFLLLPVAVIGCYTVLRSPWTPSAWWSVAALIIVQQIVMVVRAFLKLGFWGAEVAAYRSLEEPRWCRKRARNEETAADFEALDHVRGTIAALEPQL